MLRDFPITGNEGATQAEGYPSTQAGMFVKKGHGLKELDKVAPSKGSQWSVTILHIDSSRENVDYIQFDRNPDDNREGYFSSTIALISRGEASELYEFNEIAFRAMRGEKVARPWPYPKEGTPEFYRLEPKAFIRTEPLQVVKDSYSFLNKDRYQVYKGHGFLPGDQVCTEISASPLSWGIVDIIPNDDYDEVVLDSSTDDNGGANLLFQYRQEDSSLSPDQLAKRNAYISKLQAS